MGKTPILLRFAPSRSFAHPTKAAIAEPYIEQYHNLDRTSNDRWQWQVHSQLEQAIALHSLNVELPLTEIYRRIQL